MEKEEFLMSTTESFNPGVMIDGDRYEVEGWMIILSFALAGIPWALEQADDPAFDLRGKMKDYNKRRSIYFTELHIVVLEQKLKKAKEELCILNK
jgi:hypothetical protein